MKKIKLYIFLLAILVNSGCMAQTSCNVSTFYIPIDVEFFQPPTIEYIKNYGGKNNNKQLNSVCELMEVVDKMQSKLKVTDENKSQRILIINEVSKDTYTITTEKQIIKSDYIYIVENNVLETAINEIINNTTKYKAPEMK